VTVPAEAVDVTTPAGVTASAEAVDRTAPAEAVATALRAELAERAGAEARLRGQLADARAELEAGSATQSCLDAAHGELREAIEELRLLVEQETAQRTELESSATVTAARVAELEAELTAVRGALAASVVARDAAASEAEGLRAELDRLGAELASARIQAEGRSGAGLAEAQAMLAEARELTSRLRSAHARPADRNGELG